jgi:hypothetical protein
MNRKYFLAPGGIGNQLFVYSAATYAEKLHGIKATVILPKLGNAKHNSDICNTSLPGNFRRSNLTSQFFQSNVGQSLGVILPSTNPLIYKPQTSGYDVEIDNNPRAPIIDGLFQTYRYASNSHVRQVLETFRIPTSSSWLEERLRVFSELRILAVHVRRGDYIKYAEKFGVLSFDYYQRGILEALRRSRDSFDAVSIFSDDPKLVRSEFASLKMNLPISFEVPPINYGSEESLYLMSQADGLVISNSTFSWWGAVLGKPKTVVVAPKPWFKTKSEPNDLFPRGWLFVDASWQEPTFF